MENIELAKWLHDNYEEVAKKEDWNTQENCKVEFNTLPDANKRTMIEIADRLLNFDLLRLHNVSNCLVKSDYLEKSNKQLDKYFKGLNSITKLAIIESWQDGFEAAVKYISENNC